MQTTFQYQYEHSDEKPYQYVLPNKPQQKYKQYPENLQKLLKETEKCPFPKIRALIILFKEHNPPQTDIDYSDLLKQKYVLHPNYKKVDVELNEWIVDGENLLVKLQQLFLCTDRYNELYTEVRNALEGQYEQKMNQMKSESMRTNQMIKNEGDEGKKLDFYRANQENYEKTNEEILNIENNYFTFLFFSGEFERAVILVGGIHNLKMKEKIRTEESLRESQSFDNTVEFQGSLRTFIVRIKTTLNDSIDLLYNWRESVKNNRKIERKDEDMIERIKAEWEEIFNKADTTYAKLGGLTKSLEYDRQKNRKIFEEAAEKYPVFLPDYIKAKQVYEICSKKNFYMEIIQDQKRMLSNHLKKNYGMIVPYTLSQEFKKSIEPVNETEKRYLKQLFASDLEPLQFGLNYINRDYQNMYREACEDSPNIRQKISRVLDRLKGYEDKGGNEFVHHLNESCRKLLRLVK